MREKPGEALSPHGAVQERHHQALEGRAVAPVAVTFGVVAVGGVHLQQDVEVRVDALLDQRRGACGAGFVDGQRPADHAAVADLVPVAAGLVEIEVPDLVLGGLEGVLLQCAFGIGPGFGLQFMVEPVVAQSHGHRQLGNVEEMPFCVPAFEIADCVDVPFRMFQIFRVARDPVGVGTGENALESLPGDGENAFARSVELEGQFAVRHAPCVGHDHALGVHAGQQRCRVGDGQLGFQRLEIRGVHQQAGMVPGGQPAAVETSEIALAVQEFHASAYDIYAVFAARQIVRQRDEQTVSGRFVLHRISIVRNARVDELHDVARFVSAARKLDSFVGVTVVETLQFRDVRYGKRLFRGGGVVGAGGDSHAKHSCGQQRFHEPLRKYTFNGIHF